MSDAALADRSQQRRWAAAGSSHDRVIATTRLLLLLIGMIALIMLLAVAPLTVGRDISFVLSKDRVAVARERMRVADAEYRGEDSKGQPFSLRARSAVQATSRDPVVKLADLSARIALNDGPATIVAPAGRYDMSSEKVAIDGKVDFNTADGYHIETRDVAIDMKSRQVTGSGAITGKMRLGTFRADNFSADLNQRSIVLTGNARLHIVQGAAKGRR